VAIAGKTMQANHSFAAAGFHFGACVTGLYWIVDYEHLTAARG
jgi:hypothetical protein